MGAKALAEGNKTGRKGKQNVKKTWKKWKTKREKGSVVLSGLWSVCASLRSQANAQCRQVKG
jgi:hypothetical protein